MKISDKITKRYQDGGAINPAAEAPVDAPVAPDAAPQDAMSQDPLVQIAELAMQGLEANDCDAMAAACEGIIALIQGGAPAEPAPVEEPVFKKGGKIVRKISK